MTPSPEDIIQAIYDAVEKGLRVVIVAGGSDGGPVELGPTSLAALEEVQVNVVGEGGLASAAKQDDLIAALRTGTPEHHNGAVGTSPAPVNFSGTTKSLLFRNKHPSNELLISFNGGATFFTIPPRASLSLECATGGVVLQGSAPGTSYEGLVVVQG